MTYLGKISIIYPVLSPQSGKPCLAKNWVFSESILDWLLSVLLKPKIMILQYPVLWQVEWWLFPQLPCGIMKFHVQQRQRTVVSFQFWNPLSINAASAHPGLQKAYHSWTLLNRYDNMHAHFPCANEAMSTFETNAPEKIANLIWFCQVAPWEM